MPAGPEADKLRETQAKVGVAPLPPSDAMTK